MSTDADKSAADREREPGRRRGSWTVPATAAVIGGLFLAIYLAHHDAAMAVWGLVIMLLYAAVLVLGSRRSEAVALLRGETGAEGERLS